MSIEAAAAMLKEPRLARLLAVLNVKAIETRVIGGAVRNALLGLPVHEYDLATNAEPPEVIRRAEAAGLKCVPTGIDHGTVTIVVDGQPFEVTSLREDVDTDGRHAIVRFGRDFADDAHRRDFTINALSLSIDGKLHDYTDGRDDLAARRVRFIGDPDKRITEDYLRALRFFRFHAAFGNGALDAPAFAAIIRNRAGLTTLSKERVRAELMKLMAAPRAADVTREICNAGLLGPLLAGITIPARLARLSAIEAVAQNQPDAVLRLAALALLIPDDANRLRDQLRLSNDECGRLARGGVALVQLHGLHHPPKPGDLRAFLFTHGRRAALDAILLAHAESGAAPDDAKWLSARAFLTDTPEPRLPFSGADLLAKGLPSGRIVGQTLKDLQARWIRAGFPKDPVTLARLLDEAASKKS
jgi:poly(A) polymerase